MDEAKTEPRIGLLLRFNLSQRLNPNYAVLGTPLNHRGSIQNAYQKIRMIQGEKFFCEGEYRGMREKLETAQVKRWFVENGVLVLEIKQARPTVAPGKPHNKAKSEVRPPVVPRYSVPLFPPAEKRAFLL